MEEKNMYLVEGCDVYGEIYHLGIFPTEEEAEQAVKRITDYAQYREEGQEAPADLIPEQLKYNEGHPANPHLPILWDEAWTRPLPVCHTLEDCDLY